MSEDYCDVDLSDACDDAEPFEFCRIYEPIARKPYKCCECRGVIAVGERYRKTVSKYDGQLHTDRECAPCTEARDEFGFRIVGGLLWETFGNEWDNGANVQGCMNRLTSVRAKEHMLRQWRKWKGLEPAPQAPVISDGSPLGGPSA